MSRIILALACLLAACGGSDDSAPAPATTAAPAGAAGQAASRVPDAAQRSAMIDVLKREQRGDTRVWFVVAPGNAEASALAGALEAAFREAGWVPARQALSGMTLKPGPVRILVGQEEEPPAVDTTRRALEAAGLAVETGTGYRAFYEEKKRENPSWPGIPMTAEQPFLVVIAPQVAPAS